MAQAQPGRPAQSRDLLVLTSIFAGLCVGCGLVLCCCLYHCIKRRRRRQELQARRRRSKMAYAHTRYLDANGRVVSQNRSRPWGGESHFHSRWPSQMLVNNSADKTRPRRHRRSRRRPLPDDFYAANSTHRAEPLQTLGEDYTSGNMYRPNKMHEEEISRPRPAHLRATRMDFDPVDEYQQHPTRERDRFSPRRGLRTGPHIDEPERGRTSRRTPYSREAPAERWRRPRENEVEYEGIRTSMQETPSIDSSRDLIDGFSASSPHSGPRLTVLGRPFALD
ncbi:hypothetical protein C8Q69DRAFT_288177 [Paecilomyces variotii]|uniref:Uncharacterized protein n=1 Tax=Byssochlamys spectabilis TaxID=264951 RepID=A0A443HU70_BYSSP|nr:hypothetical protein C8Q69DRAFT_288177 [Paecilomyces variotii]RWQ95304.1 hypothetical protein C8Q69DRAFT_288177 [Paecilomyces variotii]